LSNQHVLAGKLTLSCDDVREVQREQALAEKRNLATEGGQPSAIVSGVLQSRQLVSVGVYLEHD